MMKIKVTYGWTGKPGPRVVFKKVRNRYERNALPAMDAASKVIFEESQRLVPFETGLLKKSGRQRAEKGPMPILAQGIVGYGEDPTAHGQYVDVGGRKEYRNPYKYAIPVHERGGVRRTTPGTTHNFLLIPMRDQRVLQQMKTEIRKIMQRP